MACQRCKSERVGEASGKCSDLTGFRLGNIDVHSVYVPGDWGIGGGDYLEFNYCLDCGQIQGDWPLPETELEAAEANEDP